MNKLNINSDNTQYFYFDLGLTYVNITSLKLLGVLGQSLEGHIDCSCLDLLVVILAVKSSFVHILHMYIAYSTTLWAYSSYAKKTLVHKNSQ